MESNPGPTMSPQGPLTDDEDTFEPGRIHPVDVHPKIFKNKIRPLAYPITQSQINKNCKIQKIKIEN